MCGALNNDIIKRFSALDLVKEIEDLVALGHLSPIRTASFLDTNNRTMKEPEQRRRAAVLPRETRDVR
jgi:hypothetical protein